MRFLLKITLFLALLTGIIYLWEQAKASAVWPWKGTPEIQTNQQIVLQEITALGKLELVKYSFRDVVDEQITREFLPNGKALLVIQGTAVGCLDLTQMHLTDLGEGRDTLIVRLPEPEICGVAIDHSQSKVYNTEFAFTDEALLVEQAFKKAEIQVKESAITMGIVEQTRQNAEKMLRPMLEKISGKKVLLRYRPQGQIPPPR